ncbi:hypothetical protein F5B22DRAFT_616548 [Xylaria bambusicola]|uniref:uncharacterized protein n=1 Tax=Xylaria bambusicola TaxID=326684 RepID=UPI002007D8BE|nr:uncharacterized protein F5B22DRAFT_616548 [Xylaria bambusicola]KAI0509501.1 hypothetical protein F5B22DRAFT_616548 [Xylaria bambusicola]
MYSSSEEITEALEKFRAVRSSANRPVLEKIIPVIENTQPSNPSNGRTKHYQRLRIGSLEELLESEPLDIRRPSELLERWDDFKHIVDGTSVGSDEAERITRRNTFFSAVEAGLKEKSPENVRESITVPSELRLLAEQVDVIWVPKLSYQVDGAFFDLYDSSRVNSPEVGVDPPYGEEYTDYETCEEYETAIGFQIGDGQDLDCWVVFSRNKNDSNQPWEWRYATNRNECGIRVFDTIPDAFAEFASYGEPTKHGIDHWDIGDSVYNHLGPFTT